MTADKTARDERLDELAREVRVAAQEYYGGYMKPAAERMARVMVFDCALAALLAAAKETK